ncbi:transcription factor HHO3-like [Argentina anserina]|uniref:transcription factor HHO3-like n=1 Tax=Argentina anserina TaxID=57926 RepID=UPI0021765F6E|nr:transcription factor HHO3-like [Potentilla anserina]
MLMDITEEMQGSKLGLYVKGLEEEKLKIQVFQRELPLCLELVTQAIERCKQEMSDGSIEYRHRQSECSVQTSSEGHVFEEFIPLKRRSSSDSDNDEEESDHHRDNVNDKDKSNSGDKKKSDWLRSVQLWNTTPDEPQKEEVPRKASVVEVKRSGGAFHPFQKEKSIVKTNGAVAKSPASAPATSSTTDTVSGGSGGGNSKKDDKEGQRKQRRNWSPELHRRFLHALQQLGGSHTATPKQIRELMKVDGLTNDEVKSHLQKYRLHTRRPAPTNNNNNSSNAQAPQFVVVGGIWVPPQDYNAAVAAANTASGDATRVAAAANGIYAPVASTPSTVTQVSPSAMHRPRPKKPKPSSHSEERASHSGEGHGHSNSTATSPSTHTPASPPV